MSEHICPFCGGILKKDVCIETSYLTENGYEEYVSYYPYWCYDCDKEIEKKDIKE